MTTKLVFNKLIAPSGNSPLKGTAVIYIANEAWLTGESTSLRHVTRASTDSTGKWQVSLRPNSEITPEGTVYVVEETVLGKTETYAFIVPAAGAGPHWLFDILTDPPGALTPSALAAETAARIEADTDEATTREEADDVLAAALVAETDARTGADADLAGAITEAETDANAYTDSRVVKAVIDALGIDAATLEGLTVVQLTAAITAAIVDASPATLDTLNELAAALGDDANFAATITAALAGKQALSDAGIGGIFDSADPVGITYETNWGIDGDGNPYYDEDGAAPGEDAILFIDNSGAFALAQP